MQCSFDFNLLIATQSRGENGSLNITISNLNILQIIKLNAKHSIITVDFFPHTFIKHYLIGERFDEMSWHNEF